MGGDVIQREYDFSLSSFDGNTVLSEYSHQTIELSSLEAVYSRRYRFVKRAIDLTLTLLLTALLAIPALLIAGIILLTTAGPVFYTEMRIGRGGRGFRIWKFRSMCHTNFRAKNDGGVARTEVGPAPALILEWRVRKECVDPRITPIGALLRRWSLDELPQLINVLLGDMSLIGPRPVVAAEMPLYGRLQPYYLAVTPGLSGLWQVSGRSDVDFEKRAQLDATYVQTWSLRQDLSILLKTVPAVLGRVGAR